MKLNQAKLIIFYFLIIVFLVPWTVSARTENCSTNKFSNGNTVFDPLIFPAGGGYNNEAKVSLPMFATIGATSVELAPKNLIGTPYIWVPKSSANQIFQIDTKTGAIVKVFSTGGDPSRVTVMPGGDTWVANRGGNNLNRYSPTTPNNYIANGTYLVGSGPRGVTFDNKGNIWAFDYGDANIYKFTAPGYASSSFSNTTGFPYIYGAIGDYYGYVWMVGDAARNGNRRINILNTKTNNITLADACIINGAGGSIISLILDNGGAGYTSAPIVSFSEGGATATTTISGGSVNVLTLTNGGAGYTSAPTVSFSGEHSIASVVLTNGGAGYTSAPSVSISGGIGTGAIINATINAGGAVDSLILTNAGMGYTNPLSVTFTGGGFVIAATATATVGVEASATAVIGSASSYIYGIGMDTQGNIFVANYGGGGYCKIGGARSGANFGKIMQVIVTSTGSRGIAVDGNNNVWMANSNDIGGGKNNVYVFNSSGNLIKTITINYTDTIGVAIDFDNNAWIVSNGSGHVLKFGAVGAANEYDVIYDINIGGSLYNYSDMTGFRSIPNTLSVGFEEYTPVSGNVYADFGHSIEDALKTCSCPDINGDERCEKDFTELDNCLVPLSLFSVTGGNYEAKKLNIACSVIYPDLFGGLVPCGRLANSPPAAGEPDLIDESKPCNLCAIFFMLKNIINFITTLAIGIGVFILIIAGLLYALSAGNARHIELAKSAASSVITSMIIIFIAWLLIVALLQILGYSNVGTWSQVNCMI